MAKENDLKEVQKYMKQIYNPLYYNTKPRYRRDMTKEETLQLSKAIRKVYNPDSGEKYDLFEELGIRRMAKT